MNRARIFTTFFLMASSTLVLTSAAAAQGALEARAEDGSDALMPLVDESLRIEIDRQFAHTTLQQHYQNESGSQVEGSYRLQVGEGARVDGFAYWNGEQKIVGEVFESNTARAVYEEVTGFGSDPGLLEQTGEGEFSFRVFPIEAAERKRIEVSFGQWLTQRGRTVEYRVPVTRANAGIELRIRDARNIAEVSSETHHIRLERAAAGEVTVHVDGARGPVRELAIAYEVEEEDWSLNAHMHRDAGHDAYVVLAMSVPDGLVDGATTQKDMTLVLDHSGSMSGQPLLQAKRAAVDLVSRMRDGDRLNVVVFDDGVDMLYRQPRAMSDQVREEALGYIERVSSGGGTDIALALQRSLGAQHTDERPHVVLFLTDGQSDAQAALAVAEADRGDARVYTIGVGHGVERPLLSRLASTNRGRFTFIASADAITERMGTLYEQLAAPILVSPQLEIDGVATYQTYPRTLPDLYRDDELRVHTRLMGSGPATIRLTGLLEGRRVSYEREIEVTDEESRAWVGRMWARSRVDDLLEEIALHGETDERKNEVIELALAYNFTTAYTSFLAIPESEMTDAAREAVESAREMRQRIMDANPDAAALSRYSMPPGDPILRVHAPPDALQVTAYFPFGLVEDLEYDEVTETWVVRFLVPNWVQDGDYDVQIVIVDADGRPSTADVPYTIDSDEPEFETHVHATDVGMRLAVVTSEPARNVTVALVSDPSVRVDLLSIDDLSFEGDLPLSAGIHELRVVVSDEARNESDSIITVEVL